MPDCGDMIGGPPADAPGGGAVDLRVLLDYDGPPADGEPDLIVELIDLYLEDAPARLAGMREALAGADAERLGSFAHGLRGSSANLGAGRVAALCQELEGACRGGAFGGASPILNRLTQAFEEARRVFEAERERRL